MKYRAYLDIETTGFSRYYCDLTVIGIALEKGRKCQVVQLIEDDLYEELLLKNLEGVDEVYTYIGLFTVSPSKATSMPPERVSHWDANRFFCSPPSEAFLTGIYTGGQTSKSAFLYKSSRFPRHNWHT